MTDGLDKEIQKCNDVLKENPDLKAKLNAAAKKYEKNHNLTPFDSSSTANERHERRIYVLKANHELMSEYKKAVKITLKNKLNSNPKPSIKDNCTTYSTTLPILRERLRDI